MQLVIVLGPVNALTGLMPRCRLCRGVAVSGSGRARISVCCGIIKRRQNAEVRRLVEPGKNRFNWLQFPERLLFSSDRPGCTCVWCQAFVPSQRHPLRFRPGLKGASRGMRMTWEKSSWL